MRTRFLGHQPVHSRHSRVLESVVNRIALHGPFMVVL